MKMRQKVRNVQGWKYINGIKLYNLNELIIQSNINNNIPMNELQIDRYNTFVDYWNNNHLLYVFKISVGTDGRIMIYDETALTVKKYRLTSHDIINYCAMLTRDGVDIPKSVVCFVCRKEKRNE